MCKWLSEKSGATDPIKMKGGDFLPTAYTKAATCACTGGGNPLWDAEVATCVRGKMIAGFKGMPLVFFVCVSGMLCVSEVVFGIDDVAGDDVAGDDVAGDDVAGDDVAGVEA
jgi:hypothetical protein